MATKSKETAPERPIPTVELAPGIHSPTQTAAMQVGNGPEPGAEGFAESHNIGTEQPLGAKKSSRKKGSRASTNIRHISSARKSSGSHRKAA